MMSSPWPTLAIAAVYLAVVFHGRRYMMQRQVQHPNRKPLQLRYILVPYNLAMALLNLYIGLEVLCTQVLQVLLSYFLFFLYSLRVFFLSLFVCLFTNQLAVTQYRKQYNWLCQPVNYSQDPDEIRVIIFSSILRLPFANRRRRRRQSAGSLADDIAMQLSSSGGHFSLTFNSIGFI